MMRNIDANDQFRAIYQRLVMVMLSIEKVKAAEEKSIEIII